MIEQIGDGVAIVLGTTEPPGEVPFRQNSQFFYLTGVTEPRASVIIDGRAKTTTVFLQPKTERQDTSQYGPGMSPGAAAAKTLGVMAAVDRAEFTAAITALAAAKRAIYTPFAAEVLGSQSQGDPTRMWENNAKDPWDGRTSREAAFLREAESGGAGFGDQGSRSDRQRASRGEERAGDRDHPRGDAHFRRRDHGGDARGPRRHARIRAAGAGGIRVQEERRARARPTSR